VFTRVWESIAVPLGYLFTHENRVWESIAVPLGCLFTRMALRSPWTVYLHMKKRGLGEHCGSPGLYIYKLKRGHCGPPGLFIYTLKQGLGGHCNPPGLFIYTLKRGLGELCMALRSP